MQLTALLYGTLPLLAAAAPQSSGGSFPANFARVENYCKFKAYVQSVPNAPAGGAPSSVLELGPGGTSFYQEEQKSGGSALRVGTLPALRTPLSMGYTPSNGLVYYDLSNQFGNPFANQRVSVTPTDPSCYKFNCAPNDEQCYSNGNHIKVKACKVTGLTLRLCK